MSVLRRDQWNKVLKLGLPFVRPGNLESDQFANNRTIEQWQNNLIGELRTRLESDYIVLTRSTVFNIPTATVTPIDWVSISADTKTLDSTLWWTVAQASRLYIPVDKPGLYVVSASIPWGAPAWAAANVGIGVYKNGGAVGDWVVAAHIVGEALVQQISTTVYCEGGDYLSISAYQDSGAGQTISGGYFINPNMRVSRLPSIPW